MSETRKVLAGSLGTLLIVVMGLFLMCAVQHEAVKKESTDDELYKKELIELLGLTDVVQPEQSQQATPQSDTTQTETTVSEVANIPAPPPSADRPEELAALLEKIDSLNQVVLERQREIERLRAEAAKLDQSVARAKQQLQVASSGVAPRRVGLRYGEGQQASLANFEARYRHALNLFNQRRYAQARSIFESLLTQNPKHRLADNCQYWIGECYFGEHRYLQALAEFEKVFSFDARDKYDDAQIMIALCHLRLGNRTQAKLELEQFLRFYPKSEYLTKAEAMYRRVSAHV